MRLIIVDIGTTAAFAAVDRAVPAMEVFGVFKCILVASIIAKIFSVLNGREPVTIFPMHLMCMGRIVWIIRYV